MLLLFINGEKGLCAKSKEGKVYFPARNSSIKKPGLYNCIEVLDKDKYGFVTGKKIQCNFPNNDFLEKQLMETYYSIEKPFYHYDKFFIKEIGDDPIIFLHDSYDTWVLYFYNNNGMMESILSFHDIRHYRHFYESVNFDNHKLFDEFKYTFNKNMHTKLDMDRIYYYVVSLLCNTYIGLYSYEKLVSITVYDEKIIKIITETNGYKLDKIYAYHPIYGFVFMENLVSVDPTISMKIDLDELKQFMIKNHYGYGGRHDEIVINEVRVMDRALEVKYHNGIYALSEISEENKKIVDESFEEIARIKRYMGKNFSKSMLDEIHKISDQSILGIKF